MRLKILERAGSRDCSPSNSRVTRVQYEAPYSEFMSAQWWHMDACSHAPLDPGILVSVIYSELQVQLLSFYL